MKFSVVVVTVVGVQSQEFLSRHLTPTLDPTLDSDANCHTCEHGYFNGCNLVRCDAGDDPSTCDPVPKRQHIGQVWCQDNCFHNPSYCPKSFCECGRVVIEQHTTDDTCVPDYTKTYCYVPPPPGDSYELPPGCLGQPVPPVAETCEAGDLKTMGPRDFKGCQACVCNAAGTWDCNGMLRRRKEISDVTDEEFDRFAAALNTLKKTGHWDAIAKLHGEAAGTAHGSDIFLHWHRKYLFDVETMLQAAADSCEVTFPYWNWALDFENTLNPAVWGPNRYGALDIQTPPTAVNLYDYNILPGFFPPGIGFFENFNRGRVVADGKFGVGSEFESTPLVRNWAQVPVGGTSIQNLQLQLQIISDQNLDIPSIFPMANNVSGYPGFGQVVEQMHGRMHGVIGGLMGMLFTSSYDPIFFAHHAHVDKIWKDWQDTHLDRDGEERFFASHPNYTLAPLVCGGDSPFVSGVDVELSGHMTGSMNGAVEYLERQDDFACGEDFERIKCCMRSITDANMWNQVARIQVGTDDVSDLCSPLNPNQRTTTEHWLNTLRDFDALTQEEVNSNLEGVGHFLTLGEVHERMAAFDALGEFTENLTSTVRPDDTTQCERRLCMSITTGLPSKTLHSVCAKAEQWLGTTSHC